MFFIGIQKIYSASGYIFRSTFRSLSDVLCSDECRTKKSFQDVKRMLPLFRAVVKFCTINRLFNLRVILCSKSEKLKNVEVGKKLGILLKRVYFSNHFACSLQRGLADSCPGLLMSLSAPWIYSVYFCF